MASNFDGLRVSGSVQGDFKCTWTIKSFSSLDTSVGKAHKSGVFQLKKNGMEWYLKIFPGGKNKRCNGHISCIVHVKNRKENIKLKVNLSLRNTDGEVLFNGVSDKYITFPTNSGHGYPKTIHVNDPKFKLVDDSLVVILDVSYCVTFVRDTSNIFRFAEIPPLENLIDDWRNLWKSKKNYDCVISVRGEDIRAHSLVLSMRSKVFAAMFEHNTLEKYSRRVQVTDFEKDTMNSFMEFLYTGNVREMDFDLALDLLRASDKYEVSHLKLYCANYLMSVLNYDNVCLILSCANMHNAENLHSHAMEYVCEKMSEDDLKDQGQIFKDQPELLWGLLQRFVKKRKIWKADSSSEQSESSSEQSESSSEQSDHESDSHISYSQDESGDSDSDSFSSESDSSSEYFQ